MSGKHTPGPWTWIAQDRDRDYKTVDAMDRDDMEPWLVSGKVDFEKRFWNPPVYVLDYAGCGSHGCDSLSADRRLIAAAPDLLSALQKIKLCAAVDAVLASSEESGEVYIKAMREFVQVAEDAIAKATGEEA